MYKMYHLGYTDRHTSIDNLPKTCPPELREWASDAVKELKREQLLIPKPTSYGMQVYAVRHPSGYAYANAYAKYAGLPQLEHGKPSSRTKVEPLPTDELRKYARMHRQAQNR
jgi:hypothetical protein